MKRTRNVRPSFDTLEDRLAPSASVAVNGGNLVITGNTSDLTIEAVSNTKYNVSHDGLVTAVTGVTGDIRVRMGNTAVAENVTVDLKGFRIARDLIIGTGTGADSVTVKNGKVGRDLQITTTGGPDTVTLGDGTTVLNVVHDATVGGGAG